MPQCIFMSSTEAFGLRFDGHRPAALGRRDPESGWQLGLWVPSVDFGPKANLAETRCKSLVFVYSFMVGSLTACKLRSAGSFSLSRFFAIVQLAWPGKLQGSGGSSHASVIHSRTVLGKHAGHRGRPAQLLLACLTISRCWPRSAASCRVVASFSSSFSRFMIEKRPADFLVPAHAPIKSAHTSSDWLVSTVIHVCEESRLLNPVADADTQGYLALATSAFFANFSQSCRPSGPKMSILSSLW